MATSLRAFQDEISSIADQKNAEHLRQLRQAQQQAAEAGGRGGGKAKKQTNTGGGSVGHGRKPSRDADNKAIGGRSGGGGGDGQAKANTPSQHDDEQDDAVRIALLPLEDILHQQETTGQAEDEPSAADTLRHQLGQHLVLKHGELIVSLGYRPSATALFGPDCRSTFTSPPAAATATAASSTATLPSTSKAVLDPSKATTEPTDPLETGSWTGKPVTRSQLDDMLKRLHTACKELKAEMTELYIHSELTGASNESDPTTRTTSHGRGPFGSWMIRIVPTRAEEIVEVRIAVVGNVDSGKSTLTGVLTRGGLDDGRGKTRVALFRHKHELETGRTSSVGLEILGFSPTCEPVVPTGHAAANLDLSTAGSTVAKREKIAWDEVCSKAAKVVSFIDLAGHERYLKTTLFGLTGCSPDYVSLIIGGNAGLIGMSKEHLGVSLALQVPIIICVTKIDMTPAHVLESTIKQLVKVLKSPGCRKIPVFVETQEQAVNCAIHLHSERICPIFLLSNVTGAGLAPLRTLLNCLPTSQGGQRYLTDAPLEFSISDVFSVPFAGSVASGIIISGKVKVGDNVLLGPDSVGQFIPTSIKSIQKKRVDVESAEAGQSVSFALKKVRRSQLRKGMVILAKQDPVPKAVRRFQAQMLVLYHNTTIQPRYQAMCHINSVRQTVRIVSIDHPTGVLRTGDRAKVMFEFIQGPEYISPGAKVLVREARCRLLGVVTEVYR